MVPINYFDYDHYVKTKMAEGPRLVADRMWYFWTLIFLFTPIWRFAAARRIEPVRYYRSLNRFFGLLEREYGIEVVIAAHPRAEPK